MTEPASGQLRILLCDDDLELGHALATLIGYSRGMELVAPPVRTGRDGVDGVDLYHPDVVLMDVNLLGQMDGFQATVLIKKSSPATNVIIMSGGPNVDRASTEARNSGAFAFLSKPLTSSEIIEAIRAAGNSPRTSSDQSATSAL